MYFIFPFPYFQTFKNKYQMRDHEASVHLKEKPYGCQQCPYRASRKQHLKSHMETHKRREEKGRTGEHKCETCDYSHDDKFYLDCHVKMKHEGVTELNCELCEFISPVAHRWVVFLVFLVIIESRWFF